MESIDPSLPTIGGIEVYSLNLLEYLLKAGVGVTLLGFCRSRSLHSNDKFTFIPVARNARLTGYEYFLMLMAKTPFMRIPISTIIHAQRPEYMLPFVLFHRKNPIIVTLHGRILAGIRLKRRKIVRLTYEVVESFALKHGDIIIAVDESTREFYQQEYPQLAAKIRVIPTGIDLSKFRLLDRNGLRRKYGFKPDDKVVAYVGRLEKEKGLDFLIDCLTSVVKLVRQTIILLVGDGRDRERLESLVRSFGLKRVVFMGTQEQDRIPEILNCADVLALSSLFEGSPTIVKEALACGAPVVSTNVGDVSQIIRSDTSGRIVSRNKEDFAHALADVLLKEDREEVRIQCAKVAAEFGFEQVGVRTVELYEELLWTRNLNKKTAREGNKH
ncbi:glycosyltransferase family 4 protein [Candidatus Bathyarchaeota archaeon]|nr:glycosyltransferase family 4 protein [Candidatus Bathyarchaeota archaeon]